MKIRSAFLTEMSGKLGGAVGSTSRGGIQYLRKLVIPANPSTLLQTAIRNAVSSASSYWKTIMSEAQQDSWWDLATGSQTGATLFSKVNQPRFFASNASRIVTMDATVGPTLDPVADAPESTATTIGGLTLVVDDSANTLTISGIPDGDPWYDAGNQSVGQPAVIYVYASHQQTPSRRSRQHPYQLIAALAWSGGATPVLTKTINLAALGLTTAAGNIMYVKTYAQAPLGGVSVPVESRLVIVA